MTQVPLSQSAKPLDVLIVGAGFSGLYMLYKARQLGLSARAIEAADSVGGTWYHNRYPGARVDIQSLEYSFSFDEALQQEWRWSERYASAPELLRYANHVADRFGLRDGIQLNTRVAGAVWDGTSQTWQVTAEGGERWQARFMVMASGPLSSPNTPNFKGLGSFKGEVLHTAYWPKTPVDFSGKRVAVIGTGSSGVQSIPMIAKEAATLTVFQRTAAYAVPAHNGPLDPALEAQVKADYAGFRQRNLAMQGGFGSLQPPNMKSALLASPEEREAEFERRWQIGGFSLLAAFSDILRRLEANAYAAEFVRGKIRSIVKDPATAKLLCPSQTIGCKRLCVDTGYYATFNRPNVKLVDISQSPIDEITATGLRTGGQDFEFDAIVLATGFDAITGTLMRIDLRGRDGLSIQDKWKPGPLNCLGLMTQGFPNMFHVAGAGSTSAFTAVTVSIEHHINWIGDCISWLNAKGHRSIEPTLQAESDWMAHVTKVAEGTVMLSCNSWYQGDNIPGKPRMFMSLFGFPAYAQQCAEVAASGYPGFTFS
jgi:cation diffusion facilitator CzcD-associated flavoprotein CzcO